MIQLFLMSIFLVIPLPSDSFGKKFTIQLISTTSKKEAFDSFSEIRTYPHARIEKIQKYYVVRILHSDNREYVDKVNEILPTPGMISTVPILDNRIISYSKNSKKVLFANTKRKLSQNINPVYAKHTPIIHYKPSRRDIYSYPDTTEVVNNNNHHIAHSVTEIQKLPPRVTRIEYKYDGISFPRYSSVTLSDKKTKIPSTLQDKNDSSIFVDQKNIKPISEDNKIAINMRRLKSNNVSYLNMLDDEESFKGFYFDGKFEKNLDNTSPSYQYSGEIKWEIFRRGYFEGKMISNKKKTETRIQYLQLMNNMSVHAHNSKIYQIKLYKNEISYLYNASMLRTYTELLNSRNILFNEGLVSLSEIDRLEMKIDYYSVYTNSYSKQKRKKIDSGLFLFLNDIENISLVPEDELFNDSKNRNMDMKLQEEFINRADYFPGFSDNLKANVFAKHSKVSNEGRGRNSVGFEVEIPLQVNGERDRLIDLEKNQYVIQKSTLSSRLSQKLSYLYMQFDLMTAQIKGEKAELKLLFKEGANLEQRQEKELLGEKENIVKKIDLNKIKILSSQYKIIKARLTLYSVFLDIYSTSGIEEATSLIKTNNQD